MIFHYERTLPYSRPPLSKQFLLGKQTRDQLYLFTEAAYRKQRIEILQGTRALAVDPVARVVQTRPCNIHGNSETAVSKPVGWAHLDQRRIQLDAMVGKEPWDLRKIGRNVV